MIQAFKSTTDLIQTLRRLCEAELADDQIICHDGGFRYTGDFASLEHEIIEPAALLTPEQYQELLNKRYITESNGSADQSSSVTVTERGRSIAFGTES